MPRPPAARAQLLKQRQDRLARRPARVSPAPTPEGVSEAPPAEEVSPEALPSVGEAADAPGAEAGLLDETPISASDDMVEAVAQVDEPPKASFRAERSAVKAPAPKLQAARPPAPKKSAAKAPTQRSIPF